MHYRTAALRFHPLPGNLVITTQDILGMTLTPPCLKQCCPQGNRKDQVTIQHCFGKRWGKVNASFVHLKSMPCIETILSHLKTVPFEI